MSIHENRLSEMARTRQAFLQQALIIFEYNATTRSQFELSEAAALLGKAYKIYRLRSEDGRLDSFLAETWNVVGLPNQGPWADLLDRQELFAE